ARRASGSGHRRTDMWRCRRSSRKSRREPKRGEAIPCFASRLFGTHTGYLGGVPFEASIPGIGIASRKGLPLHIGKHFSDKLEKASCQGNDGGCIHLLAWEFRVSISVAVGPRLLISMPELDSASRRTYVFQT